MRAALLGLGLLLLASCNLHGTAGDGAPKTETRTVPAFTGVDAATGVEVTVAHGAAEPISVTTDGNLLPLLVTTVEGGRLRVQFKSDVRPTVAKVTVHAPHLAEVSGAAGAHIDAQGVEEDAIRVAASSGAEVHVAGVAKSLDAQASSGAKLDVSGLAVPDVAVHASSGARVHLGAPSALKGAASSGATVTFKTEPKVNTLTTSSGASVEHGS